MELKITKEKVLEAAGKCSTAKQTLQVLFPEVFESDFDSDKIYGMQGAGNKYKLHRVKDGVYAWCDTESTNGFANGTGFPANECLNYARSNRELFVFNDSKEYAKWLLS